MSIPTLGRKRVGESKKKKRRKIPKSKRGREKKEEEERKSPIKDRKENYGEIRTTQSKFKIASDNDKLKIR